MSSPSVAVWLQRAAWLLLPVVLGPAVAGALDGRSQTASMVVQIGLWLGWTVGLVAVLVPSPVSLTAVRTLAPLAVLVALACGFAGASVGWVALAAGGTLVVALVTFAGEVGLAFVQASAYGDERRYPLRPPSPLLVGPLPLAWALAVGPAVTGVLLLAASQWVAGAIFAVLGAALAVLLLPRLHTLARRFLVLVPAGLVVHDQLLLAETAMFRRAQLTAVALAPADTTAVDLSGRALGNAIEVRLVSPTPLTLGGARPGTPRRPLTVEAFLVSPSRPGRFLEEASRRRLPTRLAQRAVPPPST